MFNESTTYRPNDPVLVKHYCQLFEISDWRQLPREQRLDMVFQEMPSFWAARSEWLRTSNPSELLRGTPLEGAHSIEDTTAYRRLNG
jgi:hypothetical protein